MKSVVVVTRVPLDERNGAGFRAILPYLEKLNLDAVHSVYLRDSEQMDHRQGHHGRLKSVHYHPVNLGQGRARRLIQLLIETTRVLRKDFSLEDRKRSVFVVLPDSMIGVLFGLVCRVWVKTLIVWIMDDFIAAETENTNWLYRSSFKLLYRKASSRIVVSNWMANVYETQFNAPAQLVLGKSLSDFHPPRAGRDAKTSNDLLKIVFIGSFLDYTAEPIRALVKALDSGKHPTISLSLYGMHAVPESWGDKAQSHYRGQVSSGDKAVQNLLVEHDIAILPYSFDPQTISTMALSFPSKLVDYLGAAIPVITLAPSRLPITQEIERREIGPVSSEVSESALECLFKELESLSPEQYQRWSLSSHQWAKDFSTPMVELAQILNPPAENES